VAINCCSISENLFESELFGHEKGAFTSAFNLHKGKCEIASGGTLFLDEIGELEANIQIKLLRFLQEKEFHRVGGNSIIHSDCRLITATNRNLDQDIVNRRFREDLYYRINVIPIYVPPLRKRRQDIPLLLEHFFKKYSETINRSPAKLTPDALEALQAYHYPGNIRELINIVERLSVICSSQLISFDDLPQEIQRTAKSPSECHTMLKELPEEGVPLQTVERELILKTLEKTSGNKVVASKMLGITRRLLYLRLKEYTQKASADVT
jgi:two-component system NtrC family response regulator